MIRLHVIKLTIFISLFTFFSYWSNLSAQVGTRDTLLMWKHFDYTLDDNNGVSWYSTTDIVEEGYPGVVIENEYVRLVILPEYGARIISFFYKPTGHEQFYTNPVGVPYGMGAGNFYYDWLMVFGGVFPTFPEPEHGKTWFLPWQWELTENSDERISLKMELQDTINFPGHPGKFNTGVTEIRCISTITLEKGKTSFELKHELQNTRALNVTFEYWTCTTLAPGSVTGSTFTPANSEIIAPIDYVYLKDDWWSWMGNAENPAPQFGNHVFEYNNLALYDNWDDMGIAYAYPNIDADYYGVVNHTNGEGVFRVSDNAGVTPGMKFWTWGAQQGLNADPEDFYENARPYIELWSGISTQFFEDASLPALETISWTETYLPTIAMDSFSIVNAHGALYLGAAADGNERFLSKVFMNQPDSNFSLRIVLDGDVSIPLYDDEFTAMSESSTSLSLYLDDYSIPDGDYTLSAAVTDENDEILISSTIPVTVPLPVFGIPQYSLARPDVIRMNSNTYKLVFPVSESRIINLYAINGRMIDQQLVYGSEALIQIETAGFYVIQVIENGHAYSIKIKCM